MTLEQRLTSDPLYLVERAVFNNPKYVAINLEPIGIQGLTPVGMVSVLSQMYKKSSTDVMNYINVEYRFGLPESSDVDEFAKKYISQGESLFTAVTRAVNIKSSAPKIPQSEAMPTTETAELTASELPQTDTLIAVFVAILISAIIFK